jgi:hypothetical protein
MSFESEVTFDAVIDSSSLRDAKQEVEDSFEDVEVSVDATANTDAVAGTGSAGRPSAAPDGGGVGGAVAETAGMDAVLGDLEDIARDQLDVLEEMLDELEMSNRQGAQESVTNRIQTILLGRAALGGGGGGGFPIPTGGGGGGALRGLLPRGAAGTAPVGVATTQNVYGEGEEPPGIFGEGKSIMDVLGREEAIIDAPAVVSDFAEGFRGIEWSGFGADVGQGIESNTDLSIDYSEVPKSITELTPNQRREFSGAPDPEAPTSITDLTSDQRRAFSGAPGPGEKSDPTELPLQRMKKYAYQKRSDQPSQTSSGSSGSSSVEGNRSTTKSDPVRVNQQFSIDGISRSELDRELERAKREAVEEVMNRFNRTSGGF